MPDRETEDDELGTTGIAGAGAAGGTAGHTAAGTAGATTAGTAGGPTAGTAGGSTAAAGHAAVEKAGTAAVGKAGTGAAGTAGGTSTGTAGGTTSPAVGTAGGFTGPPLPAGFTGATRPSISAKGALIAAAAIAAAIVAAVTAVLLLRQEPPQQTATQPSPTTITKPTPGATPGAAAPDGAWLRGRYHVFASPGWPEQDVTITSDCAACDATVTGRYGTQVLHWAGAGWAIPDQYCGEISFTPTVVVDGIVQELSVSACAQSAAHTLTRIGD